MIGEAAYYANMTLGVYKMLRQPRRDGMAGAARESAGGGRVHGRCPQFLPRRTAALLRRYPGGAPVEPLGRIRGG